MATTVNRPQYLKALAYLTKSAHYLSRCNSRKHSLIDNAVLVTQTMANWIQFGRIYRQQLCAALRTLADQIETIDD